MLRFRTLLLAKKCMDKSWGRVSKFFSVGNLLRHSAETSRIGIL